MTEPVSRAAHMAERVHRTALSLGIREPDVALLDRAHALAMEPRRRLLSDDHDPAFLHPGRTVLILLLDVGLTDVVALSAAALSESENPSLAVPVDRVRDRLGDEPADYLARLPDTAAGGTEVAEALVTAPEEVQLVVLAERLDQIRHLHIGRSAEEQHAAYEAVKGLYLPVSERVQPTLARRFRWWCGNFERRMGRA